MCPFLTIFFTKKNVKFLIDPLKGAAPLTGVIGYNLFYSLKSKFDIFLLKISKNQ